MDNSQHIPGLIRGHAGTIIMVEHGKFESTTEYITVKPEVRRGRGSTEPAPIAGAEYASKFGTKEIKIPVDQKDMMTAHIDNFLSCMPTREKPPLNIDTGPRPQLVLRLTAQSSLTPN